MSVILTDTAGKIAMVAPGVPMLWQPLDASAAAPPVFSAEGGLTGWWDAAAPAGLLDSGGQVLTATGGAVSAVADKSGAGTALSVWHAAGTGSAAPLATPRLSGLLGGVGLNTVVPPALPTQGQQLPVMDPDQGLISTDMPFGAATAWTLAIVWSRPNWRQSGTASSTILSVGGIPLLAADNNGGTQLVLFPGTGQAVLSNTLTRRHTHAVVLRNTPDVGIDAWLDGTQVASGVANPLAASLTTPLLFLHDGGQAGGAECWFHEATLWNTDLAASGIATVHSYLTRWVLGPRKGIQILVTGQSNAGNGLNDGAWHLLAQGVAWHLGALGYGVVGSYGSPPAATCIHGEGIYPVPALGLSGSFLDDPGDGSDPSSWELGADGQALQSWIQASTDPTDAADIAVIFWPWSEDDSTRQYSEKATYEAAARRLLALERGMLSRSAASLPHVWWSAIPFAYGDNDPGMQMQREVVADMVADSTQNVTVVLPQTADTLPRSIGGSSPLVYDPTTGVWSGGDPSHRDIPDNQRFGRLAAPLVARAILASEGGDSISDIPTGVPAVGGPAVSHVYRQSDTVLVVTVQHDCGTELIVPATLAAQGIGWAVMDGGSPASPGSIVTATSCVRLNATQVQVTLNQSLVNASSACRLFYPYGAAMIGRGNAVTDNLGSVTPPAGWDIAGDLGSAWSLNMPVHVPMNTASGVVLSDTSGPTG